MKSYLAVLIAAVTVNCLLTTINATNANDTLAIPYTDMLLPPLDDVKDNSNDAATNSVATKTEVAKSITTTKKPITSEVNNILPELSIEALLPPLYESKIEKEEDNNTKQTTEETKTEASTTTTTERPSTTKPTTTLKPSTTTTLKPTEIEIPSLFLDSLLPPLHDNTLDSAENTQDVEKTTTTHKPLLDTVIAKTTKKSYYQQQAQHLKDLHLIDEDETHPKNYEKQLQHLKNLQSTTSETKNYNKQKQQQQKIKTSTSPSATLNNDKQTAESKIQTQQEILTPATNQHLHSNIGKQTLQHVAQQVIQQKHQVAGNNGPNQYNYNFDFYLGSTTARPPKSGLPTITPFPYRLGR